MADKQHQKDAMAKIKNVKPNVSRFDYINANKIANEAVRIVHGLDKSIKKDGFNLEQMETRQVAMSIITSVTELKAKNDSNINVRNTVLSMFTAKEA